MNFLVILHKEIFVQEPSSEDEGYNFIRTIDTEVLFQSADPIKCQEFIDNYIFLVFKVNQFGIRQYLTMSYGKTNDV